MGTPTVTLRCPSCGTELRAVVAPAPPTQWFPCPRCHATVPVVVPRDLPPLFSWEVIPGLYPQLSVPRGTRWRPTVVTSIALAVAAVLAAGACGLLGYEGYVAAQPAVYVVSGTVFEDLGGGPRPVGGAQLVLFTDANRSIFSFTTSANGTFRFTGVPAGGIELNVTAPGCAPVVIYTFATRAYSTQTQDLRVVLGPGGANNTTSDVLSPFADLETLLAYVGGGSALFGTAAVAAGVGALVFRRPAGAAAGVVGASAAVAVPVVLIFLSLSGAFPAVTVLCGIVGAVGAFSLVLAVLGVTTRAAETDGA